MSLLSQLSKFELWEEVEWIGPLLDFLNQEKQARVWLLASLSMLFALSYSVIFVVYFKIHDNTDHIIPFAVLGSISGTMLLLCLYKMYVAMGGDKYVRQRNLWETPEGTPLSTARSLGEESFRPQEGPPEEVVLAAQMLANKRVPKLDYVKLLVVFLVMVLHICDIVQCKDNMTKSAPYTFRFYQHFTVPFIMPLVVFCSGAVDSCDVNSRRALSVLQLLLGCVIIQYLYLLLMKWTFVDERGKDVSCFNIYPFLVQASPGLQMQADDYDPLPLWRVLQNVFKPFYHLWYVYALVAWRMIAPYWMRLRYPIIFSVVLSVLSGFIDGEGQALYRIMGYLPFYITGVVFKQQGFLYPFLQFIAHVEVKAWSVALLLLNAMFAIATVHHGVCMIYFDRATQFRLVPCSNGIPHDPAMFRPPEFHQYIIDSWAALFGMVVSTILGMNILSLLPDQDFPVIRAAGGRTLVPYIFHVLPLVILSAYTNMTNDVTFGNIVPLFCVMTGWTVFLYIPIVNKILNYLPLPPVQAMGLCDKTD